MRRSRTLQMMLVGLVACAVYINSVGHAYVLDDFVAIKHNRVVTLGVEGIPTLLVTDQWYGHPEGLRVPQYRPIPMAVFALQWQFFPDDPRAGHVLNILLYGLCCMLIFRLLHALFGARSALLPLAATVLYATHPIHTEVVDNIKSLDEILTALFGAAAVLCALRTGGPRAVLWHGLMGILYMLCLCSKESGMAFLLIIPLCLYYREATRRTMIQVLVVLGVVTIAQLTVRHIVLSRIMVPHSFQLIDNIMLAAGDTGTRVATALTVMLRYLGQLIIPYPLSYDRSFADTTLQGPGSPWAIASALIHLGMLTLALKGLRHRSVVSFALLVYLIAIAPASNLFVLIGSSMADRLLFLPSLGFCLLLAAGLLRLTRAGRAASPVQAKAALALVVVVALGYAQWTVRRNPVWKDNLTLFTTDAAHADRSARIHFNLGSELLRTRYPTERDRTTKNGILQQAHIELVKALSIHPGYVDVNGMLAQLYLRSHDFAEVIKQADIYLAVDANKASVLHAKGCALIEFKRYAEAEECLQRAIARDPLQKDPYKDLGRAQAQQGRYEEAITNFTKCLSIDAQDAECHRYLARTYQLLGQGAEAAEHDRRAQEAAAAR